MCQVYFILFFTFTILYWFCHTSIWICHGYTHVPHPEPLSHFPPCTISLGHPSAPAPSILYHVSGLVIHFIYDIIHVSMPFSQIIPPSPSPTESKRLFYNYNIVVVFAIHWHESAIRVQASGSFMMSWLFQSGGQSTGVSAPASVLEMNIQGWLPGLQEMQTGNFSPKWDRSFWVLTFRRWLEGPCLRANHLSDKFSSVSTMILSELCIT